MHPALCRMDQLQAGWGQSPGHGPHRHQQPCFRAVLSTWHLLQLYLCGSESALSSELSSFSSEEIPILPMNSSRWWSSISAMSCRTVTNPAFTAVHWGIICLPSELYLCPSGWHWVWPSYRQSHLCSGGVLEDTPPLQHPLGHTLLCTGPLTDRSFSHLPSCPAFSAWGSCTALLFPKGKETAECHPWPHREILCLGPAAGVAVESV